LVYFEILTHLCYIDFSKIALFSKIWLIFDTVE